MTKLIHISLFVIWSVITIANASADDLTGPATVEGAVPPEFIKGFVVDGHFQIPAVLYFDSSGCLLWSAFGPDVDHKNEFEKRLTEPDRLCEKPVLPSVLQTLKTAGLPIQPASLLARPALIWYGSDSICQSCAAMKQTSWPELIKLVPEATTKLLLELK